MDEREAVNLLASLKEMGIKTFFGAKSKTKRGKTTREMPSGTSETKASYDVASHDQSTK